MAATAPAARRPFAVLADDLTGALASAASLRAAGLRTKVLWGALPAQLPPGLVVDMRNRDAHDGIARVKSVARELSQRGELDYELRIDSTLRGQPAESLNALTEAAGLEAAITVAIPAFPGAGRTTVDGVQRVVLADGERAEQSVAERVFPGQSPVLLASLGRAGEPPLKRLAAAIESGQRRFIADAEDERDLRAIAAAVISLRDAGQRVITASPGAWLRFALPIRRFMVVVIASLTPPLGDQLETLKRQRQKVRALTPEQADQLPAQEIEEGETLVIETGSLAGAGPGSVVSDGEVAVTAARSAAGLIRRAERAGCGCHGVLASGGWAAAMVLDALAARELIPQSPIAPLCSHSTVAGGEHDGMDFYAKGGSIGGPETLMKMVDSAWRRYE